MRGAGEEDPRILYVMGQDRSGTTILGRALGAIEGFVHVGEMRNLWLSGFLKGRLCGCGVPVPQCPFWAKATEEALQGATPRDMARWQREALRLRHLRRIERLRPGRASGWPPLDACAGVVSRLYRSVARLAGARVVVDTSKRATEAALVARLPGIDASFLQLVRDPRATAHSSRRRKSAPGYGPNEEMWVLPPWRSARGWIASSLAADRVLSRLQHARTMRLRYEDFAADPRRALSQVLRMVGEEGAEAPISGTRTLQLTSEHTAGGNPGRFTSGAVEIRPDEEWLTRQPRADRLVVTVMTLPFLHRYGYPLRPGRERSRG